MSTAKTVAKPGESGKVPTHSPERLKFRRVAAALSMTQAAAASGYSKSHISMLEAGGFHTASPECLKRLADAYGCAITDLMSDELKSAA